MPLDFPGGESANWPPKQPPEQEPEAAVPPTPQNPPAAPAYQSRPPRPHGTPGIERRYVGGEASGGPVQPKVILIGNRQANLSSPNGRSDQGGAEMTSGENGSAAHKNRYRSVALGISAVMLVVGAGAVAGDVAFYNGKHTVRRISAAFASGGKTLPEASAPVTVTISPTTPAPETSNLTTTSPSASPTASPTTPESKLVLPATDEGCVEAMPLDIKVGQLVEPAINTSSDMSELQAIAKKYHVGSWLVLNYPLKADKKTVDTESLIELKNIDKDLPALVTVDGEGGKINRLPGVSVPPGPDAISATKPKAAVLQKQLTTYYKAIKQSGADVNLAPVADIAASRGQADGRLFRTATDAKTYMPVYLAAAKAAGMRLTFKHFPEVLTYGNTDLKSVTGAPYAAQLKSGALNSYKLVKGTNNWVMMGSAKTPNLPNKQLDNSKIDVFNPAAYSAAEQLTGNVLFITDALNGKAVSAVAPQDKAAALAIENGADIAMIVPRDGKSTTDTKAAIKAIEKDVSKARIDAAFTKVLASKAINACTLLLAEDDRYAKPESADQTTATPEAQATMSLMPATPTSSPATGTPSGSVSKKSVAVTLKPVVTATKK